MSAAEEAGVPLKRDRAQPSGPHSTHKELRQHVPLQSPRVSLSRALLVACGHGKRSSWARGERRGLGEARTCRHHTETPLRFAREELILRGTQRRHGGWPGRRPVRGAASGAAGGRAVQSGGHRQAQGPLSQGHRPLSAWAPAAESGARDVQGQRAGRGCGSSDGGVGRRGGPRRALQASQSGVRQQPHLPARVGLPRPADGSVAGHEQVSLPARAGRDDRPVRHQHPGHGHHEAPTGHQAQGHAAALQRLGGVKECNTYFQQLRAGTTLPWVSLAMVDPRTIRLWWPASTGTCDSSPPTSGCKGRNYVTIGYLLETLLDCCWNEIALKSRSTGNQDVVQGRVFDMWWPATAAPSGRLWRKGECGWRSPLNTAKKISVGSIVNTFSELGQKNCSSLGSLHSSKKSNKKSTESAKWNTALPTDDESRHIFNDSFYLRHTHDGVISGDSDVTDFLSTYSLYRSVS